VENEFYSLSSKLSSDVYCKVPQEQRKSLLGMVDFYYSDTAYKVEGFRNMMYSALRTLELCLDKFGASEEWSVEFNKDLSKLIESYGKEPLCRFIEDNPVLGREIYMFLASSQATFPSNNIVHFE
jgi:hypothetical protein